MAGRAFVSRFSPNRTDPAVLEAIFVQRHRLAEVWLERLRDSVLTGVKHHLLAVGPRGCGKSHLVALLVGRLRKDPAVMERVRIAWLPEDETTPSFWKFLLRIFRALNTEYGDEFPPPPRKQLSDVTDDRRSAVLIDYLLKKLGGRTLLVVVENLDDVMRGLKDEGQKRWRAFLQEHAVAATLATAQQLTEAMSGRERPFFNFFQIEHLQPLTTDEALTLLRKIAEYTGNSNLAGFLQTPTGRARVRAIRHIAGGSHRVFIILSEFATRENLDELVLAFEELLDELTPYYQDRLRWLPDQQREIVEFLCRQARTVAVKQIAGELFQTEQTAGAQLKSLRDKGYVTAGSVGRESRYELAEPLMRLCVEVKDTRREPIPLLVEFLQVWYDQAVVKALLQCLPADADLERRYFHAALQAHEPGIPNPIDTALNRDLEAARATGKTDQIVPVLVEWAATTKSKWHCSSIARELHNLEQPVEALVAWKRSIELDCHEAVAWNGQGNTLWVLGRYGEALASWQRAIELDHKDEFAWSQTAYTLNELGRYTEALSAWDRLIELNPSYGFPWSNKAYTLNKLGRHAEALVACNRAIQIDPHSAIAWNNRGNALNELGRHAEAQIACDKAIALNRFLAIAWKNRGRAMLGLDRIDEAANDFRQAIKLDGNNTSATEMLAKAHVLQGNWAEAERVLSTRFRLRPLSSAAAKSKHLPELIATIFRTSTDRRVWAPRVGLLADIAGEAQKERQQGTAQKKVRPLTLCNDTASPFVLPKPLIVLGDSLVRSLTKRVYTEASPATLDAWADVWREVAERHPDLSLAVRLFGVGVRYVQTKDERVLLDLVQEERSILGDLFGLKGDEEGM